MKNDEVPFSIPYPVGYNSGRLLRKLHVVDVVGDGRQELLI